jgi:TRAP-type uncharacterized transport system substrate-binding protein
MPRILSNAMVSVRDLLATAGPLVLLALALLAVAYWLLDPAPPKRVVLATGPEDGDYAALGKRYAAELKRYGIEVVLKTTAGSAENQRLLRDRSQQVDLAFVQGGSSDALRAADEEKDGAPVVSLGSLSLEPVWLFYREQAVKKPFKATLTLADLQGWRVNTGARGSGTPGLIGKLLHANGIERESLVRSRLDLTPAVVALLSGDLDAIAFTSAPEAPMVQMLLQSPGVKLFEFAQAEAYARRMPFLSAVVLPRGIVDLARNLPARDTPLVATTTALVARERTHPALLQLFVQAAHAIHSEPSWLARAGQFPSPLHTEFPLAQEAERYYRNGTPLLQRYLPFWLANLIDRMWVVLASLIVVLIPVTRVVPPLYVWRIRRRVFRSYRRLREIELAVSSKAEPPAKLLDELNRLDATVEHVAMPLSYTEELYTLRGHIQLVRERLASFK